MMEETKFGRRDEFGHYAPKELISYGPLFTLPPKPMAVIKWLPGYFLPWNLLLIVFGIGYWLFLAPSLEQMKTLEIGWGLYLVLLNYAIVVLWYGAWHSWLYVLRRQETRFKYNPRWPTARATVFVFGKQALDNIFWTITSGVPVFTAYQVAAFYLYANGYVPLITLSDNPIWFIVLLLLVPFIHEVHFYAVHRLLHTRLLYKYVHSLHHNNTNVLPWSGLAMHPVEHILYFSVIVLIAVFNSHPIHMLAMVMRAGLAPAIAHTGFDRTELGGERTVPSGVYAHYLHHKLFEVNYADGAVPLDKWFGSFHDGSPEADERLKLRMERRAEAYAKKDARA
ncbi:sterol desaturase family protein [Bradyrhizobium guangxiense]|uniref:sterol desaturase family protein n=1 Tax=Bradyrhizobium guangxiense TaxID=1325115 RepID=UPI00100879B4|nr:sterol desaturase family protein [Bradyrhizobium guangxiense]